mmetsp:Transcript_88953/g.212320  ORF Transcript_88953/g.212320 Transcript_88953/m.212320 type:complete len:592 (-) Transcript_88953:2-1777(-)
MEALADQLLHLVQDGLAGRWGALPPEDPDRGAVLAGALEQSLGAVRPIEAPEDLVRDPGPGPIQADVEENPQIRRCVGTQLADSHSAHVLNQCPWIARVVDGAVHVRRQQLRARTGHVIGLAGARGALGVLRGLELPGAAEEALHELVAEGAVVLQRALALRTGKLALVVLVLQRVPVPELPLLLRLLPPSGQEVVDGPVQLHAVVRVGLAVVGEVLGGLVQHLGVLPVVPRGQHLQPAVGAGHPAALDLVLQVREVVAQAVVSVVGDGRQFGCVLLRAPALHGGLGIHAAGAIDAPPQQVAPVVHRHSPAHVRLQVLQPRLLRRPVGVPLLVPVGPLVHHVDVVVPRHAPPQGAHGVQAPEPGARGVVVRRDELQGMSVLGTVHSHPPGLLPHIPGWAPQDRTVPVDAPHGVVICVQCHHVAAAHHVPPDVVVGGRPAPLGKQKVLKLRPVLGAVLLLADHPNGARGGVHIHRLTPNPAAGLALQLNEGGVLAVGMEEDLAILCESEEHASLPLREELAPADLQLLLIPEPLGRPAPAGHAKGPRAKTQGRAQVPVQVALGMRPSPLARRGGRRARTRLSHGRCDMTRPA